MQRQLFAAASLAVIISITAFAPKSDLAVSQGNASPSNSERQEPISGTQSVASKEGVGLLMEMKMAQTIENWNKIKGALFEYPLAFYQIAGETSGLLNADAIINGDGGKAFGVCQFDYRYDLVGFMRYAFHKHPELWTGFSEFLSGYENGDNRLRSNHKIGRTFLYAMEANYEVAISDQLEYVRKWYWDDFAGTMIRGVYRIRNTILAGQYVGYRKKGTTTRYRQAEPQTKEE